MYVADNPPFPLEADGVLNKTCVLAYHATLLDCRSLQSMFSGVLSPSPTLAEAPTPRISQLFANPVRGPYLCHIPAVDILAVILCELEVTNAE